MIEPTISLGNVIAIIATVASAVGFVWAIRVSVTVLDTRLTAQDKTIDAIRVDVEKLNEVVSDIGRQQTRMDVIDERMQAQGRRFDEHITRFNRLIDERLRER
jgi:uncharacterized coiled-coil protein SlyX